MADRRREAARPRQPIESLRRSSRAERRWPVIGRMHRREEFASVVIVPESYTGASRVLASLGLDVYCLVSVREGSGRSSICGVAGAEGIDRELRTVSSLLNTIGAELALQMSRNRLRDCVDRMKGRRMFTTSSVSRATLRSSSPRLVHQRLSPGKVRRFRVLMAAE